MNITSPRTIVELPRRELLELADARGGRIVCLRGTVWVTRHGDFEDHLLTAGESVAIGKAGSSLVQGLEDAAIALVSTPESRPQGLVRRTISRLTETSPSAGDQAVGRPCLA
ncbi:MAG: DUF2917 domain-containing protein [Burkholderiaceae bacterium]|nr:DUF2917 domain-containing protein [Burkholderiaceae bacterium]